MTTEQTLDRPRLDDAAANEVAQTWGSLFFSPDRPAPKLLVVTAAARGEGATQITAALALTGTADGSDVRVLAVDLNVREPQLAEVLGCPDTPGIAEVLAGTTSLDAAICPVGGGTLSVLPAGAATDHPLGLLRSDKLKDLLKQLSERFDHVLIDTAAANVYPDVQWLSALADGTVIVAVAGQTRRESIAEARKRIEMAGGKPLGVVLNRRTFPVPGFLYRHT